MNNLEHLQLAKEEDEEFIRLSIKENVFFKEHGYSMYDYPSKDRDKKLKLMPKEYRKIKALEIIAEELCKMNIRADEMNIYLEQTHDHRR